MSLLVILLLMVINVLNTLTFTVPAGMNAGVAWTFSCLVFVFGALVAYAGILIRIRVQGVSKVS